jgi:hypothetical protein
VRVNLFLKDRFGALQVAGWTNQEQGVVDCDIDVIYSCNIVNTGEVDAELVKTTRRARLPSYQL